MSTLFVPDNMKKTEWAYSNVVAWREHRSASFPDEPCRTNLIESLPLDTAAMVHWLARHACETRNVSSVKYPTTIIFSSSLHYYIAVAL